jgi:hypothetical protein
MATRHQPGFTRTMIAIRDRDKQGGTTITRKAPQSNRDLAEARRARSA